MAAIEKGELISDTTWTVLKTTEAHQQVIRELIDRDKNHACVVMWSIANEAARTGEALMSILNRYLI